MHVRKAITMGCSKEEFIGRGLRYLPWLQIPRSLSKPRFLKADEVRTCERLPQRRAAFPITQVIRDVYISNMVLASKGVPKNVPKKGNRSNLGTSQGVGK
jgi:hypothetical protein